MCKNGSVSAKTATVSNGYASVTLSEISDVAIIGAAAANDSTDNQAVEPAKEGKDTPKLLWLYVLLPCLAVVGAVIAVLLVKRKRK